MRRHLALALPALLVPGWALAQAAERQEVAVSVALAAAPAAVWEVAGDFGDFTWHPAVHAQTGDGRTRTLVLGEAGGPTIEEELIATDPEAMRYAYRITDVDVTVLPVSDYTSELSVRPRDGGGSVMSWHGTFRRGDPGAEPGPGTDDAAAIAAVTGIYEAGMAALADRFGTPDP